MLVLITGGCGFIGSSLIRHLIKNTKYKVMNIDSLTYASNIESLALIENCDRYSFEKIDIRDKSEVEKCVRQFRPDAIINLAAESHVDRSINSPSEFISTNILGTFNLLEVSRNYWETLDESRRESFRFHHVSTDEVYGDLPHPNDCDSANLYCFSETSRYRPSSPYSASKASSDHLVRAWHRTFDLPVIISNCSNNFGPWQNREKLIPSTILSALKGQNIPLYGDGSQIRDWLYVEDHARALHIILQRGKIGESYNVGGNNELQNIDVVKKILSLMSEMLDEKENYTDLIQFVKDRPGHDRRYAIDSGKIKNTLGWAPAENFESGLRKTIRWYVEHFRNI